MSNRFKFKITNLDKEMFFLKIGNIIYYDYSEDRVYAEDGKQYMPIDLALSLGLNAVRIKEGVFDD